MANRLIKKLLHSAPMQEYADRVSLPTAASSGPSPPARSPLQERKRRQWAAIKDHLLEWYAEPDLECLRASFSVYLSHFEDDAPIWLFLLGPPSTGKTELCINPLSKQLQTHTISTITESSFISSFNENMGILPNLKDKNGVLLFSDFSNFLALRPEVRSALQAQMREIYDGKYQKHAGNSKKPITWEGKVTILAACTPELERYWGLENSLGDRFLQMRLNPPSEETLQNFMQKQFIAGKKQIARITQRLVDEFLEGLEDHPTVTPPSADIVKYLFTLSNVCVSLRQAVHRDYRGMVTDVGTKEGTPRFARMALNLAKTHAKLFARQELSAIDNRLMRRVLLDTCPRKRLRLIRILLSFDKAITCTDLHERLYQASMTTVRRGVEDFQLLGLIDCEKIYNEKYFSLTSEFRQLLQQAGVEPLESE